VVKTRLLEGFDDPTFGPEGWERLLDASGPEFGWLTWLWQRTWWQARPDGKLLLIVAERDGEIRALAPFCASEGLVSFVGTGAVDYVDFLGDAQDGALDALLQAAVELVPDFYGFSFHYLPATSSTGRRLPEVAERLGFRCYEEAHMPAPTIDLAGDPEAVLSLTRKKSLVRHENFFRREGVLEVTHLEDGREIARHLDEFFEQHVTRWKGTEHPSRFEDPAERMLVEKATRNCAEAGWLRFTRIDWNGRAIAFHYGSAYGGRYYFGTTAYERDLSRHSPGQVLLRQLLLAAVAEGAQTFDFGLGDEPFKLRFATHVDVARAYGLYRRMS
jgi:CelD/BcsL family acetyltransferase involved in cellulose biosynthesis